LYLLEPDEAPLVYQLELRLWVNDEIRQSASTDQLIFGPEETLTELSQVADWETGDVLLTGTPGGVALNLTGDVWSFLNNPQLDAVEKQRRLRLAESENPRYLREGDRVRAEIRQVDGPLSLGVQDFVIVGS
ncbi:fumarylacetoacetate hydrolase family protein, partial [Methylacidiphilum caldifontis]|uniref:fumarylacetoacetate hydrolase family protein n=1 Tax=Methylacidiphilum caldifontis TaxID=2795386 RepID=UPI00141AA4A8